MLLQDENVCQIFEDSHHRNAQPLQAVAFAGCQRFAREATHPKIRSSTEEDGGGAYLRKPVMSIAMKARLTGSHSRAT